MIAKPLLRLGGWGGRGGGWNHIQRLVRFQVSEATKEATSRMIEGQLQSKYNLYVCVAKGSEGIFFRNQLAEIHAG